MNTTAKTLVLTFSILFTLSSFAFDTYEPQKCSRDTCILSSEYQIGFNKSFNRDGEAFLKLNTKSSLLDIPFEKYCFRGDTVEVKDILHSLAGNTNGQYSQGGHFFINGLSFDKRAPHSDDMMFTISYESDYDLHESVEEFILRKCK